MTFSTRTPTLTRKSHLVWRSIKRSRYLYLFLLPALAYLIVFNYLPMYGIQIAFKYYSPVK